MSPSDFDGPPIISAPFRQTMDSIGVVQYMAVWPFIWGLVTTHPLPRHDAHRPVYVRPSELRKMLELDKCVATCDQGPCYHCLEKKDNTKPTAYHLSKQFGECLRLLTIHIY